MHVEEVEEDEEEGIVRCTTERICIERVRASQTSRWSLILFDLPLAG